MSSTSPSSPDDARDLAKDWADHERKLKLRALASVLVYVVFLVANLVSVVMQKVDAYAAILLGLLIFSIILMPRQTLPSGFQAPEKDARAQEFLARMMRIKNWLAITRFIFFSVAILTFLVLPRFFT